MALSFKVLGQSTSLTGNTNVLIYGVPYYTSTVVSSLNICNTGNGPATFDIAFRRFGANLTAQHYFAYRTPIALNESIAISAGITLDQSDIVSVSANTANVSFSLFGSESTTQGFTIFPFIEYLLVGGGGGGAGSRSAYTNGGGGGGGFMAGSFTSPQTGGTIYTITVGGGGAATVNGGNTSISGAYIPIGTVTAYGGGAGRSNAAGQPGGSGGGGQPGGAGNFPAAPAGFDVQGYAGGLAGAGGAAAAGTTRDGGAGRYSSLAEAGGYYSYYGGGGGGTYNGEGTGGNGGIGGGGAGYGTTTFSPGVQGTAGLPQVYGVNSTNGQDGYGGGGGNPSGATGAGGSGVVIIRYASAFPAANAIQGASALTPNIVGGYRYYRWTSSGTFTF